MNWTTTICVGALALGAAVAPVLAADLPGAMPVKAAPLARVKTH